MGARSFGGGAARELSEPGRESELRQARDVVDAQFLHHRFAITADGMLTQVEDDGDFLAGLPIGDEAEDLQFARGEMLELGSRGLGFEVALLDAGEQAIGCALRAGVRSPPHTTMPGGRRQIHIGGARFRIKARGRLSITGGLTPTECSSSYIERTTTRQSG